MVVRRFPKHVPSVRSRSGGRAALVDALPLFTLPQREWGDRLAKLRPLPSPGSWTVVCGVDEGEHAPEVVRVAERLAERLGARLVLVHVMPEPVVPGLSTAEGAADELRTIELERGHRLLAELAERKAVDVASEHVVVFGPPTRALRELSEREGAELIVVGRRGRGPLASAVLGSVSSELSRTAPCPVVVVPPQARE